jgi:6-phosphogluconate dehydrogenase
MKIAIIGLGRMGASMARRLARAGTQVIAFDRAAEARAALAGERRVSIVDDHGALLAALPAPRIVWLMLPAGDVTQSALDSLAQQLQRGDIVVDGGNAFYKDSMRRAAAVAEFGLTLVDAGVSGGVWGLDNGYGLMVGGPREAIATIKPVLQQLAPAPDRGWVHCGPSGAGHFAKMVHNGIEYGMMQALAEGLALMQAKQEFGFDLAAVTQAWRDGTVIRSWLLDLTAEFLRSDAALADIAPHVADSGEGRWTTLEAVELGVPAPVMSLALMARFASQGNADYGNKLLAMMRKSFGGHATKAASLEAR